ncbi:fatty acid-binding protein-like [Onthophagus taurus]|uniref:fatty acid-binding protein-like n=1 Tax=Onthophagus taurus TaxID=166361 RepID=UPI000C2037BD|nr:fatty acid-binding protein, liver-type-like [Onthophagus taurus]
MALINGKYAHESNENFEAYIMALSPEMTPELAKKYAGSKSTLEISVTGDQCTISSSSGRKETFTFGQSFKDDLFPGQEIQSTATLNGNKVEVKSSSSTGISGSRVYEFSDSGLVVTYTSANATAKRIYKRV